MSKPSYFETIRASIQAKAPDDFIDGIQEVRPFYWFLIAGLVVQYGFTVYGFPTLREPARLTAFTAIMIAHAVIHWLSPHLVYKTALTPFYIALQSGIAFALILISDSVGLTYGLFAPLLGEILGMFRRSRSALVYSLFVLGVSFVSYLAVTEGLQAWVWIATAVPIAVFVWLYVALYTRQVQAREQTQLLLTELEEAHHQLAEYATRVEDLTLVAERQRLARELHDTLAQGLAGLILQLEAADSHLGSQNPEKAQAIVQQAMTRARATLADARRAIGDLRATALAPADLNAAIRAEAERFTHTTGIPCALNLCEAGRISPQTAENALRTVSEGLMNIARHAQATAASLSLTCDEDHLWVEIHDNGVGFDPAGVVGHSGHFGLLGLRERARLLGGLLTIESQPSQGATLKIQLPLAGNQNPSQPLTS